MKIKRAHTPLLPESRSILVLCFLLLTAFNGLTLIFVMFSAFKINKVAERKVTFAQLVNGQTLAVTEKKRYWRYQSVIHKVVSDWTTLTFSWDDQLAGSNKTDPGVSVGSNSTVTTNSWFASLLLEPEFGKVSLQEIAKLTPSSVFTGQTRSVAIVSYLSDAREIRQGEWEVDVVSTRLLINRTTGQEERIPFNRTFTLKAVEISQSPLGKDAPLVEQKIYEIRSAGLEITKIVAFTPK